MSQAVSPFKRQQRILRAKDFSAVFNLRHSRSSAWFQLSTKPNSYNHARLGLVVTKKIVPHAVGRNRIKRMVRELFRQHGIAQHNIDLVVRAKRPMHRAQCAEANTVLLKMFNHYLPCPAC